MQAIEISNVASSFRGSSSACCCGCTGSRKYASQHVTFSSQDRGYEVTPEEVSDRAVKMAVNLVNKNLDKVTISDAGMVVVLEQGDKLVVLEMAKRIA